MPSSDKDRQCGNCIIIKSTISIVSNTSTSLYMDKSFHPILTDPEWNTGCRLDIDTWADIRCFRKHLFQKFIDGKIITAAGYIVYLGALKDLPIENVLYEYDTTDGTTIYF